MGCCCGKASSDIDDLEHHDKDNHGAKIHKAKSWHDNMSLKEKKKIAKKHQAHECFLCKCCGIFGAWSGLKCCCCAFNPDEPLMSIKDNRHCTDVPCCLLFLISVIAQAYLVIYAYTNLEADPRWFVYISFLTVSTFSVIPTTY